MLLRSESAWSVVSLYSLLALTSWSLRAYFGTFVHLLHFFGAGRFSLPLSTSAPTLSEIRLLFFRLDFKEGDSRGHVKQNDFKEDSSEDHFQPQLSKESFDGGFYATQPAVGLPARSQNGYLLGM